MDHLSWYMKQVGKQLWFTAEEEVQLYHQYMETNNENDLQKLITPSLTVAVVMAKRYRDRYVGEMPLSVWDLVQEANIGILKALNSYDPTRKRKFTSWATFWIKSQINIFALKNSRMISWAPKSKTDLMVFLDFDREIWYTPDIEAIVDYRKRHRKHLRLKAQFYKTLTKPKQKMVWVERILKHKTLQATADQINYTREGARVIEKQLLTRFRNMEKKHCASA